MKITNKILDAACNAYDDYNKSHSNVLLRGVATGHGMRAAIEAAMQAAWISVDDRLPEHVYIDGIEQSMEYLVWDNINKKVSHDYFHSSRLYTGLKGWNHYGCNVTHWMPLPEYKGE